eukprot:TRINITY_DN1715_c0_g1_i1.p1 TRINITY_DN1715_c0_g1~~TRINITY_DN1715_c0_g1_i1.p1  ORF type:complete len:872 (-),score=156.78 TRINITY_DN1715_c0_g1_i1:83-2698(-)
METQYPKPRQYGSAMKMAVPPPQSSDNDRSSGELRALDCNLTSLCDHIQIEGFNSGAFSDIVVHAMGSTYHLHRLILSRSSYFRNMLHGPWKEASAPVVTLHIDDDNVNGEAIAMALAYLYGHHPKLNDSNAFRVLAAASFLDLQDLCAICTDFIISELWTTNFLAYQVFAESQDYGIHGERVRNACWGYLCQSGTMELREVLPKLSSQTLHALLTSNALWVPSEEKRFELALYTLLAKSTFFKADHPEQASSGSEAGTSAPDSVPKGKNFVESSTGKQLIESELGHISLQDNLEGHKTAHKILVELADCVVDFHSDISDSKSQQLQQGTCSQPDLDSKYSCKMEQLASLGKSISESDAIRASCAYVEMRNDMEAHRIGSNGDAMEGPSEESTCYHVNSNIWLSRDQSRHCSVTSSCNGAMPNDWGKCSITPPSWGGRIVGRQQLKNYGKGTCGIRDEEYDAFINIFEGGSLLYSNMSFEALLNVRKQLEELGFPCKSVNDGLWLQMLLSQRVQEIGADTCKNCCLSSMACACRQPYGYSHGGTATGYYRQEHDRNSAPANMGNIYLADTQGEGNGLFGPVRVHVRGPMDGLAGIGRGATFVPAAAWPPTRFVFSRVPFGLGNRNCQQSPANDESEARGDLNGDLSGDGLTALVGLSQGNIVIPVRAEQTERAYEGDLQNRLAGAAVGVPSTSGIAVQIESQEHALGIEWENAEGSFISLDLKTPLRHFPPFRFGVEFDEVHRLTDGQVKHSPEVFYAGSLWKVSVQAFNDEDPQGRRTLGLFLHRRKAETTDSLRKLHMYVDSREKVTARYQLICPSKREVMVFGSFKQTGTLLPKAPKGWGWRTALLFDELADLLQGGALRVAAVVQLV